MFRRQANFENFTTVSIATSTKILSVVIKGNYLKNFNVIVVKSCEVDFELRKSVEMIFDKHVQLANVSCSLSEQNKICIILYFFI